MPPTTVATQEQITSALDAGGISWTMSPPGTAQPVVSETVTGLFVAAGATITRTSPQTGGSVARGQLPADIDGLDAGDGAVWATVGGEDGGDTAILVELDPTTLTIRATWPEVGSAVVVTGPTVWTAGSDLVGRSSVTGAVTHRVALPAGTYADGISRDDAGTTVVVGTDGGQGANEEVLAIDAATGAVEGSQNFGGATNLEPAGPIDGTVWVAMAGGHAGVIQRLTAPALSRDPACNDGLNAEPACTPGSNYIRVYSGSGTLWISQQDGYSHCVTPVSDTIVANLPLSLTDYIIYVGDDHVFAMDGNTLRALPIPAACRTS